MALGASNLTLGFSTVLATARSEWGQDVEVLAAVGYGRSYGAPSTIAMRTLPGILQSGLWTDLARLDQASAQWRLPARLVAVVGSAHLGGGPHRSRARDAQLANAQSTLAG